MDKYIIGKYLGEGSFGKVMKGNMPVALKYINITNMSKDNIRDFKKEIELLVKLSKHPKCSPYVVCYYTHFLHENDDKKYLIIVTEYIEGYTLNRLPKFEEKDLKLIMAQSLSALKYIHSKKIVHRDIKLENMMVDTKNNKTKLIDFGLSCEEPSCRYRLLVGTLPYYSPELIKGEILDFNAYEKADIWSLGVVFYLLTYQKFPFEGRDSMHLLSNINKRSLELDDRVDININSIISSMLTYDYLYRPSARELLLSFRDYFKGLI